MSYSTDGKPDIWDKMREGADQAKSGQPFNPYQPGESNYERANRALGHENETNPNPNKY